MSATTAVSQPSPFAPNLHPGGRSTAADAAISSQGLKPDHEPRPCSLRLPKPPFHLQSPGIGIQASPGTDLPAEDLLALLFSNVISDSVSRKLARSSLKEFGSIGAVFSADDESLTSALAGNERCFAIIRCVNELLLRMLKEPLHDGPILNNISRLYDYLRLTLANVKHEEMHILFLNSKNALLKDEIHSRGTVNHTPVYPREVIRSVLKAQASAIIIVHNHPSGDPSPSAEDVNMTTQLQLALKAISVELHDHIIVGRRRCESFRSLGLLGRV